MKTPVTVIYQALSQRSVFFILILIALNYVTKAISVDQRDEDIAKFADLQNFRKVGNGGLHNRPSLESIIQGKRAVALRGDLWIV